MVAAKYDKYLIRELMEIGEFAPNLRYSSEFSGSNFTFRCHLAHRPWLTESEPPPDGPLR
jgi:hypothetical protein